MPDVHQTFESLTEIFTDNDFPVFECAFCRHLEYLTHFTYSGLFWTNY